MRIKVVILFSLIVFFFLLNIFNSNLVSTIYSKKFSTNLQLRKYPIEMCNDIIDFKIKNLNGIIIGDSHAYSSINLEKFNSEYEDLVMLCALPRISFHNNISLAEILTKKYNPEFILIGLSPFQFLLAEKSEEFKRNLEFDDLIVSNPFSFRFSTIKRYIQHKLYPVSELEVAINQEIFFSNQNLNFFDQFSESIEDLVQSPLRARYNSYSLLNESDFYKSLDTFCKNSKKISTRFIFLEIPIPDFFSINFKFYEEYKRYIEIISKCFTVITSDKINKLSSKSFFLDRRGEFRKINNFNKNNNLKYDISHMNYVGSLKYTNFIIQKIKVLNNEK